MHIIDSITHCSELGIGIGSIKSSVTLEATEYL